MSRVHLSKMISLSLVQKKRPWKHKGGGKSYLKTNKELNQGEHGSELDSNKAIDILTNE